MISSSVIISRLIAAIICLLFPIVILIYYKRKEKISLKPVIIAMMVFIVFTQILEKLLHSVVLGNNLITNPVWLAIYGGLAAGYLKSAVDSLPLRRYLKISMNGKMVFPME